MAVVRVNKTSNYAVMSNYHFREKEMSLKAKGLLSLMLSLPDDWDYSINGLAALSKDGKDSVMNALTELEQFGYLTRTKTVDSRGRFNGYDYDIFECPQTGKPYSENPNTENPNTENPPQLNTKELNTKKTNTKESKERKTSFDLIIEGYTNDPKVIELLQEWLKVRKAKRAAMTDRAIQMNIDKLNSLADESNMNVETYLSEIIRRGWAAFYPINNYSKPKIGANGIAISDTDDDELDGVF